MHSFGETVEESSGRTETQDGFPGGQTARSFGCERALLCAFFAQDDKSERVFLGIGIFRLRVLRTLRSR